MFTRNNVGQLGWAGGIAGWGRCSRCCGLLGSADLAGSGLPGGRRCISCGLHQHAVYCCHARICYFQACMHSHAIRSCAARSNPRHTGGSLTAMCWGAVVIALHRGCHIGHHVALADQKTSISALNNENTRSKEGGTYLGCAVLAAMLPAAMLQGSLGSSGQSLPAQVQFHLQPSCHCSYQKKSFNICLSALICPEHARRHRLSRTVWQMPSLDECMSNLAIILLDRQ